MKFTQRLGYYFAGLAIGLIFLAIFLRKKQDATDTSFCYLPNCRVLKELRTHEVSFSPEYMDDLSRLGKDTTYLAEVLLEGDIDFKKSNPRGTPCKDFVIDHRDNNINYNTTVSLCDSVLIAKRLSN